MANKNHKTLKIKYVKRWSCDECGTKFKESAYRLSPCGCKKCREKRKKEDNELKKIHEEKERKRKLEITEYFKKPRPKMKVKGIKEVRKDAEIKYIIKNI